MIRNTSLAVLTAGFALAASSTARAQTKDPTPIFVDINVGAQTQARTFDSSTSFPLYQETAVISAAQSVGSGGLFDISGGYRVYSRLSAGIGFSIFSDSGDGSLVASIPSPIEINKPATSTTSSSDLKHREVGTHLMASWLVPIDDQIDATISVGPSFYHVTQDILSASVPAGTRRPGEDQSESRNAPRELHREHELHAEAQLRHWCLHALRRSHGRFAVSQQPQNRRLPTGSRRSPAILRFQVPCQCTVRPQGARCFWPYGRSGLIAGT